MSQQIQITGGAKVRNLQDVIIGTSGVLSSVAFDVANGVPRLDSNGKILVSQLPNSVMEYKGTWNANTNTPTLVNGTGNQGDVYLCNVAGTVNFGAGAIAFVVGDQVIYSGSIWQRASGATGTVTSVAITESGDSLNITGSPITTSGTINIGFNGTNLQYVNGAGNLTTFPTLTGYVPYTGATQDVDLGAFKLNAQSLHIKGTAGNGHLGLKHQSASATASANEVSLFADSLGDLGWLNGNLYLSKFITSGNTAARSYTFPDATCNIPNDSLVVHLAGTETITGAKTFSGGVTFTSSLTTNNLTFANSGFFLTLQPPTLSVNRTVTLPNGTGTLALTSDIPSITGLVPYTGATGSVNLGAYLLTASGVDSVGYTARGSGTLSGYLIIKQGTTYLGNVVGYNSINANARKYVFISDVDGTNYKSAIFELSSLTNNTDRTYTLPDATGTIALVGGSGVGTVTSVAALTIGTSGTDLSSTVATSTTTPVITLNVPTASAANRGALSAADWTTFNNKQSVLTNPVTGTGTTNYLPKFTGTSTIGNSAITDDGSTVSVGSTLKLSGNSNSFQVASIYRNANRVFFGGDTGGYFFQNSGNTATILNLNDSGNLGLGVTPSAWLTSYSTKALQIGPALSLFSLNAGAGNIQTNLVSNAYVATSGSYIYLNTEPATYYQQRSGAHAWFIAPSGTAGNAISFTQAMTLDASGRLGIGTTSPTAKLDVNGEIRMTGSTLFRGMSSNTLQLCGGTSSSNVKIDGSVEVITMDTNGATRLTIASTGAATFSSSVKSNENFIVSKNGSDTIGQGPFLSLQTATGTNYQQNIQLGASGSLDFWNFDSSSWNMRMRITSGGNLLIHTTVDITPDTSSKIIKLGERCVLQDVVGVQFLLGRNAYYNGSGWYNIVTGGSTGIRMNDDFGDSSIGFYTNPSALGGSNMPNWDSTGPKLVIRNGGYVNINNTANTTYRLYVNGDVAATAYYEISDLRKKNILSRDGDVAYFNWKDGDTKRRIGYIAQEVKEIYADQVQEDNEGFLSVNYTEILVQKVRDLEKEIELLKAKFN